MVSSIKVPVASIYGNMTYEELNRLPFPELIDPNFKRIDFEKDWANKASRGIIPGGKILVSMCFQFVT